LVGSRQPHPDGFEHDDAVGLLALAQAIGNYEPSKKNKLNAFARKGINEAIADTAEYTVRTAFRITYLGAGIFRPDAAQRSDGAGRRPSDSQNADLFIL
jgi:hypothetical protein